MVVDHDVAADLDHRAVGELGLLDLQALLAVEAEQPVAGEQRPVPLPRTTRDEHVDAAEYALGLSLDLVREGITQHRGLDVADEGAVADL